MPCVAGDITDDVALFPCELEAEQTPCETAEDTLKALKYTAETGSYMYMAPEVGSRLLLRGRMLATLPAFIRKPGTACVI